MKKLLVMANWKSNKTVKEAEEWIKEIGNWKLEIGNLEIVLCPPFTLLYPLRHLLSTIHYPFKLGAQDVSPFPDGAYTGEISARMLKDLGVEYIFIGHSERRKYFKEDEPLLADKVKKALEVGLIPIFCVQDKTTTVPEGVKIILYEPLTAIGSGTADNPENANEVAFSFKDRRGKETKMLYGGSVTPENIVSFCQQPYLDGVGVGGASLEAEEFIKMIENASQI